jgi:hypothetical protein
MSGGELIDNPVHHPPEGFGLHGLPGATDSRQRRPSSRLPTSPMPRACSNSSATTSEGDIGRHRAGKVLAGRLRSMNS